MWIPVVVVMLCRGCGNCVQVCPDNAIAVVDKKAVIDYNGCTCCGVCDRVCQIGALELKSPQMPPELHSGVQLATLNVEVKMLKQGLRGMKREVRL